MHVDRLDHLVLTVTDLDIAIDFYTRVLGMRAETFGDGRRALRFGDSKINLHLAGHEFEPKAVLAAPGTADLCLIIDDPVSSAIAEIEAHGVTVIEGPVPRTGALGPMVSCYLRDPDGNLLELSNYVPTAAANSSDV